MVYIQILKSCSGDRFSYKRGHKVEVGNDLALDLINAGYAQEIKREKPIAKDPDDVKNINEETFPEEIEIKKAVVTEKEEQPIEVKKTVVTESKKRKGK